MIDMTKFTVVRYGDRTNGRDNLGALSFSLDSPLAERTENHQALATGTSYNPHTSEHSEWLTKVCVFFFTMKPIGVFFGDTIRINRKYPTARCNTGIGRDVGCDMSIGLDARVWHGHWLALRKRLRLSKEAPMLGKYPPVVSNSWCGIDYEKCQESFSTLSLSCDTLSQGNSQLSQYSNLSDDDRFMYKAEVKTISEIAALTSSEKVEVKDDPFTCKCGSYNTGSTQRFVFWDRQCAEIIGITVSELRNQMIDEGEDDPKAFPLTLDMLLARTMTLRVKSVSINVGHDPDNLQVLTPSKRLSTDLDLDVLESPLYKTTQLSSSKMTKHIKIE
ncbi:hypothetical protein Lal_00023725 [Lupinus albus]|nr:hypothetical protein Lal_00023725 [Lupinus albus]